MSDIDLRKLEWKVFRAKVVFAVLFVVGTAVVVAVIELGYL